MTQDPTRRLRNDPNASERVRRDLEHAQVHAVHFDLEAGLRKFGATLDALESGAASASGGSASAAQHVRLLATKWWAWTLLSAATLGLVWWTQTHVSPSPARGPHTPEQSATGDERAASSDVLPLSPTITSRKELEGRAAEQRTSTSQAGSTGAQGGAQSAKRAATQQRGGAELASGRGSEVRAKATRERANRARVDSPDSKAAQAAVRAGPPDTAASTIAHAASDSHTGTAVSGTIATHAAAPTSASAATSAEAEAAEAATSSDTAERRLQAEVEHLARVRRLLTREPAQALAAARDGQSAFPGGLFHEERAALIVFALARLERRREALHEARAYLHDYPRGPFALPVSEIVSRYKEREP